jgi:hypothetical protein
MDKVKIVFLKTLKKKKARNLQITLNLFLEMQKIERDFINAKFKQSPWIRSY